MGAAIAHRHGQRLAWLVAPSETRRASVSSANSELPAATAVSAARPNDPRAAFARAMHPETRKPSQESMIRNTLRMWQAARGERATRRWYARRSIVRVRHNVKSEDATRATPIRRGRCFARHVLASGLAKRCGLGSAIRRKREAGRAE